jgi:hypothetical protein
MKVIPEGARKIVRNISGGALILLGVVGLALPFLQGIALILAGFLLLDFEGKEVFVARARGHRLGVWIEEKWRRFRPEAGSGRDGNV